MNILNAGYVKLIEHMGGDDAVIRNARRCWRSESKGEEADRKLIRHLLKEGHKSPFEAMVFTFDVKAPLFVTRQWFRHRMSSFNEESLRYCIAEKEWYVPASMFSSPSSVDDWDQDMEGQFKAYKHYVATGMPKEQARALLPMGLYTKWYWTVNGSSLINFLNLRTDKHAQKEIQEYAWTIYDQCNDVAPVTFGEWYKMRQE